MIERKMNMIEMDKHNPNEFAHEILKDPSATGKKLDTAREDVERLLQWFEENDADIPDFQVMYDRDSGHVRVFDVGDALSDYHDKHKQWVQNWQKTLQKRRRGGLKIPAAFGNVKGK